MNKVINHILNIFIVILLTLTIFVTFILVKRNSYGYFQSGLNTYTINNNILYKIKTTSYDNIKEGDKIYYYIQSGLGYDIASDVVTFKSIADSEQIYVMKSKPDETISSERVIGKLDYSSKVLGIIFGILTSKKGYTIFLIIPLLLITIYKIYNLISLPMENTSPIKLKTPIKLNENINNTNVDNRVRRPLERMN